MVDKMKEALDAAEYALDRATCFKHQNSSQKKVEEDALKMVKQALALLETAQKSDVRFCHAKN